MTALPSPWFARNLRPVNGFWTCNTATFVSAHRPRRIGTGPEQWQLPDFRIPPRSTGSMRRWQTCRKARSRRPGN